MKAKKKPFRTAKRNGLKPRDPAAPKKFNASHEPCDADVGPCGCGAWHDFENLVAPEPRTVRQFCNLIIEVTHPNEDGTATVTKIPLPCPVGLIEPGRDIVKVLGLTEPADLPAGMYFETVIK